jgi:hypothetical protein
MSEEKLLTPEFMKKINDKCQFRAEYWDWIESLWKLFEPFAPNDFKKNYLNDPAKFNGLTWEMFLASTLLKQGYTLERISTMDSPDLCLHTDSGARIWIECCYANRRRLPLQTSGMIDVDGNILRVTTLIGPKIGQHRKWIKKGLCKDTEPFIIAINGYELDLHIFDNMLPEATRAVYPIGNLNAYFYPGTRGVDTEYAIQSDIPTRNGSPVNKDYFLNEKNSHISGLLYSIDWFGRSTSPPKYAYIPNIYGTNPLPIDLTRFAQVIQGGRNPDHLSLPKHYPRRKS